MMDESKPLYYQIKSYIQESIKEGKWTDGEQLPTEKELCEMFKVSRTTVRQAFVELEQEGIIKKHQGKGTFVQPAKIIYQYCNTLSFSENMSRRGFNTSQKLLSVQVVPARGKIIEQLRAEALEPVVRIERLRYVEEQPIMITTSYMKWKTSPTITEDISHREIPSLLTYLFEKENIQVVKSQDSFEPILLDAEQAKLLETNHNSLGLLIESTMSSTEDEPVEYSLTYVRGDCCKIYIEYVRQQFP